MIPKNFTVAEIDELINVQNNIFIGPFPFKIISEELKSFFHKNQWGNTNEIIEDLKGLTKTKNLEDIGKVLSEWKSEISKEQVESTVTPKEQLEVLKKELEERKKQSQKSKQVSKEDVERLKQRAEKIYLQSKTETPETSLDNNDVAILENLAKSASSDPKTFVNDLSQTINQKNGVDIESSQIAALDLYERITTQTQSTPPEVFLTTASHFDSEEIREASLVFGKLAEENNNQLRKIFTPILGKNLSETFYPSSPRKFEITNERTDKTLFEVDPMQLVKDYKEVNPFNVLDKIKEAGHDHVKNLIVQKIEALPAKSAIKGIFSRAQSSLFFKRALPFLGLSAPAEVVATSFVGKSIQLLFPKFAPVIADFGTKLGINIGIKTIAPVVEKAVGTTAVKAVGNTLGKVAVGILAKVGISIPATAIPFVNIAVWAVTILSLLKDLGKLIKELGPKIKKWLSDNAPALIGIGAVGLLLGNPLFVGLGIVSISAGLLSGASLAKMGARTAFFFGRIGASMAITIATPVIVALIVFPILVAIILFIINSGAYIIPPKSSSVGVENPYIRVEKTVVPKGPLQNSDIPVNVEYTITIIAKKSPLTNVRLEEKCEVLRKGTRPGCPSVKDSIPKPDEIGTISPSNQYTFSYSATYLGNLFIDSFVSNIITVTADTVEKTDITTSGSASIIIGEPDIGCYKTITSGKYAIPSQYLSTFNSSIFKIIQDWPPFVAKSCPAAGGIVNIGYGGDDPYYWGWHLHQGTVDFILYEAPLSSLVRTEFVMIHELGHHIEKVNSDYYQQFLDWPGIKWPVCTYTATSDPVEAFPETLGLYGSGRALNDSLHCGGISGNFKDNYPANWEFADKIIFH